MTNKIAIFGCGGFGREVLQIVRDINIVSPGTWDPAAFLVDDDFLGESSVQGLPVYPYRSWLKSNADARIVVAIGSSALRLSVVNRLELLVDVNYAKLIHPRAWLGQGVEVGDGSVICAGALLTTDIALGNHVHVNIASTVGHDAKLCDYVTLNPSVNISGNCSVEEGVEVGTGSVVLPKVSIGHWSIVGAGSVVTKSLGENVTAVGAPAKVIKTRPESWQRP